MTAPAPAPGARPDDGGRQEAVARAICLASSPGAEGCCADCTEPRRLAAAAVAADDAWRAQQAGGAREAVAQILLTFAKDVANGPARSIYDVADDVLAAALTPADHEPAAACRSCDEADEAIQRVLVVCDRADARLRKAVPMSVAEQIIERGDHTVKVRAVRAAVSAVQPAATEAGQ